MCARRIDQRCFKLLRQLHYRNFARSSRCSHGAVRRPNRGMRAL
jgi:hypothetical protein